MKVLNEFIDNPHKSLAFIHYLHVIWFLNKSQLFKDVIRSFELHQLLFDSFHVNITNFSLTVFGVTRFVYLLKGFVLILNWLPVKLENIDVLLEMGANLYILIDGFKLDLELHNPISLNHNLESVVLHYYLSKYEIGKFLDNLTKC